MRREKIITINSVYNIFFLNNNAYGVLITIHISVNNLKYFEKLIKKLVGKSEPELFSIVL